MKTTRLALVAFFVVFGLACSQEAGPPGVDYIHEQPAEAKSFLGKLLYPSDPAHELLEKLNAAKVEWEAAPENADAIIWYGRRTAYLGRYQEAIQIYSDGIEIHPDDPRLYRHRGHRYISTRKLDLAIADFEKAASLVEGKEDEIEPDGMPNALGIPVSTLHSNIWYHLGLAHYLKGDFQTALSSYENRLASDPNNDMLVSTAHWHYMALMRLGRKEEAAKVLEPITIDMEIVENQAYHQLCLFYKGEIDEEELLGEDHQEIMNAAIAYGLGNWYFYNDQQDKAIEIFEDMIKQSGWAAFGHIDAEAEIARLQNQ
jgi:tetratricopeptide (TPR) repeat protein